MKIDKKWHTPLVIGAITASVLALNWISSPTQVSTFTTSNAAADAPLTLRQECQRALTYAGRTAAERTWLRTCVSALDPRTPEPTPTPTPTAPPTTPPVTPTPTPTVTPTPPPTTPPPSPGFPGAGDTGTSGSLLVSPGLTVSTNGAVVENLDIRGRLTINADNVVVRNVKVSGTDGTALIWVMPGATGTTISHCEVDGKSATNRGIYANSGVGFTVDACNIHHVANGVEGGSHVHLTNSFVHDIVSANGWHANGIIIAPGITDVLVQHNTMLIPETDFCSSVVNISGDSSRNWAGSFTDVLIDNNLIGGCGFTFELGGNVNVNFRATNNRLTTRFFPKVGIYGPWYIHNSGVQLVGNTIFETGAPV